MNNPFYGVACQTLFRFVDRQDLQIKPLNVPQLKGLPEEHFELDVRGQLGEEARAS